MLPPGGTEMMMRMVRPACGQAARSGVRQAKPANAKVIIVARNFRIGVLPERPP